MPGTGIDFLDESLASATGLRDLARLLGVYCLDNTTLINSEDPYDLASQKHIAHARHVVRSAPVDWPTQCAPGDLVGLVSGAMGDALRDLAALPSLAVVAFLEGLCAGPLRRWFAGCHSTVQLQRGDPFPLPRVDTTRVFRRASPHAIKRARFGSRLANVRFQIFTGGYDWPVSLCYEDRHNLDDATWACPGGRFPTIISHSPFEPQHLTVPPTHVRSKWWWGVRPKAQHWSAKDIVDALTTARDEAIRRDLPAARIAVLPEMSLPTANALGTDLASAPKTLPELVVAGSSHPEPPDLTRPTFVNETNTYLKGALLWTHRKIHPYVTDELGLAAKLNAPIPERLDSDRSVTIACGSKTRLAVLICADLIDAGIIRLLLELGVNLLLVPTLSFTRAGAPPAIGLVASENQGVGVSVNEIVPHSRKSPSFTTIVAVPTRLSTNVSIHVAPPPAPVTGLVVPQAGAANRIVWL